MPQYAHLPMIHGPDGAKLSKRHGAVNVLEYRDQGFLPEALLNYLLRLGWSHGDQEIFTVEEMIRLFDLPQVNRSAAQFDPKKLLWVNQQHMLRASRERLGELLAAELARRGMAASRMVRLRALRRTRPRAQPNARRDGRLGAELLRRLSGLRCRSGEDASALCGA